MTKVKAVMIGGVGFSLHWLLHFAVAASVGGLVGSLNPLQLLGL